MAAFESFCHSGGDHADEEVNIYSGRKGKLIEPMLEKFQKETDIKVNLITAKSDALIKGWSQKEKAHQQIYLLL